LASAPDATATMAGRLGAGRAGGLLAAELGWTVASSAADRSASAAFATGNARPEDAPRVRALVTWVTLSAG
jgi:hypothetical protein